MLTLQAKEKEIEITTPEEVIRGTVGAKCKIVFDDFWFSKDYRVYVVFKRDGYEPIEVEAKSSEEEIEIPYNILAESGEYQIGVYGENETETTPTLYSDNNRIRYGTDTHATNPPIYKPSVIYQLQNGVDEINQRLDSEFNGVYSTISFEINGVNSTISTVSQDVQNLAQNLNDNYYTKADIDAFGFASKKYVDEAIDKISTGGGEVDLRNYYTKEEIDELPAVKLIQEDIQGGVQYATIVSPNYNGFIEVYDDGTVVFSGGRLKALGEPEEDDDATTKGYVDRLVGDIESLLGGI